MKLVKPMAVSFLCRPLLLLGRQRFAVTSLVGFSLTEASPARLVSEIELWPAIAKASAGLIDEGLPKSRGEALLFGSCHTPGGKPLPVSFARMQLGAIDKRLAVIGDRYWQESAWKNPTTEPVPFIEMPLSWERAFGGPGYAKNPTGRGLAARTARSPPQHRAGAWPSVGQVGSAGAGRLRSARSAMAAADAARRDLRRCVARKKLPRVRPRHRPGVLQHGPRRSADHRLLRR